MIFEMADQDPQSETLKKVVIDLEDDVYGVEVLWTAPVGDQKYELRNAPFLAYGYSELDLVASI